MNRGRPRCFKLELDASPALLERRSTRRLALCVSLAFAAFGAAWVSITDIVLYSLVSDEALIARIETLKGWTFVVLASALLYGLARRSASRIARAQAIIGAVLDSIADGLLLLGPERTIVHANPAAVKMLGCKNEGELVGMSAPEFSRRFRVAYPTYALVPPEQFVSQRVFTEGGPLHYKVILNRPGSEVVISATAAAVRDHPDAPPALVVSVMHDITASEKLERLRDQLFAAAAHTLKTPIAIIKTNVQVLSRGAAPQLRRSAATIERQCDRIDWLVQNLLAFCRLRSQTLQLYPSATELGPLLEGVTQRLSSQRHPVHTEVLASVRVRADPERLAMAVRNLIDEGQRSSSARSVLRVVARVRGDDAEIGLCYQPLPPEQRTCEGYGEYGELSISRSVAQGIVAAHGGSLREETRGEETTLWVRLPAIREEEAREHVS